MALEEQGVTPDRGEVVVTGAAGGVGSIAIPLLAGRGFKVVASTGRAELDGLPQGAGGGRGGRPAQLRARARRRRSTRRAGPAPSTASAATRWSTCSRPCSTMACVAACGLAGGAELQRHRVPLHPARRAADRHRFGPPPGRPPPRRVGPAGAGPRPPALLERMTTRDRPGAGAGHRRPTSSRRRARPGRGRHPRLRRPARRRRIARWIALCYKPALCGRKNPALGRFGTSFRVGVAAAPSRGPSLNMNSPRVYALDGSALAHRPARGASPIPAPAVSSPP